MRFDKVLVQVLVVASFAALSACDDGGSNAQARLRLLNVSPDYGSLDLYTADKDASSDTRSVSAVATGGISGYVGLTAGTYTIKFKRNGVSSTLQTMSGANLAEDSDRTFISYGSTGHFGVMQFTEDNDAPDNGYTKVQLFNASDAGALDVYFTDSETDLKDASPAFTSVGTGGAGSLTTLERGDFRLRVTGTGDAGDLRLDVANITLANKGVLALILTSTPGGVLVNATELPQGGSPTAHANTKARLRAAVGIANGTRVSARVGGVSLLNNSVVGFMSSYAQVDSGFAAVTLSVDGASVPVPNLALTTGGEYTLLVWSNASGTQTTLIEDENHLPEDGDAKLRILNGASALAVPLTLAVDYSPIAEGIDLSEASVPQLLDPGTSYQLDVTNSNTGANVFTRGSVTLQTNGVYTLFMSSSATPAAGTVRKDR